MLIGIHGKKMTGKTTVANMVCTLLPSSDVHVMAFADKLKELCHVAFDTPYHHLNDQEFKEHARGFGMMTPRQQMISLADIMKKEYGCLYFVNVVQKQIENVRQHDKYAPIVVSDVRYETEAAMIRSKGGVIWHVLRDIPNDSEHSSEAGIKVVKGDSVIHNNGTMDSLRAFVLALLRAQLTKS